MNVEAPRWYRSKVDWWLAVILVVAPLVGIGAVVAAIAQGENVWIALPAIALFPLIYAGLVFPMRYGITEDAVVVRYGLVRQRIPLRSIVSVSPTNNPLSSPALSLDRLQIDYGEGMSGSVMISPDDKEGFLSELAARAGLRRDGARLVRTP